MVIVGFVNKLLFIFENVKKCISSGYKTLKFLKPKEIKYELNKVHGTSAPSFATVNNRVSEFKRERVSMQDEPALND